MPRDDRQRGGVMCLYKNELNVEKIKTHFPIKTIAFMEVILTVWSKKVCLVTIYHPKASKKRNTQWQIFIRSSLS